MPAAGATPGRVRQGKGRAFAFADIRPGGEPSGNAGKLSLKGVSVAKGDQVWEIKIIEKRRDKGHQEDNQEAQFAALPKVQFEQTSDPDIDAKLRTFDLARVWHIRTLLRGMTEHRQRRA